MIDAIRLAGTVFSGLSALVIEDVTDGGDVIRIRAIFMSLRFAYLAVLRMFG
jgi:hypothetical protein